VNKDNITFWPYRIFSFPIGLIFFSRTCSWTSSLPWWPLELKSRGFWDPKPRKLGFEWLTKNTRYCLWLRLQKDVPNLYNYCTQLRLCVRKKIQNPAFNKKLIFSLQEKNPGMWHKIENGLTADSFTPKNSILHVILTADLFYSLPLFKF
jgi:hypothetical protein